MIDGWNVAAIAHNQSRGVLGHSCNCVGCCRRCGSCVTWSGHTLDYCALMVRQRAEREVALADRAARELVQSHDTGRTAVGRRAPGDDSRATRQHTRRRHEERHNA
jgi:hypothetical protein